MEELPCSATTRSQSEATSSLTRRPPACTCERAGARIASARSLTRRAFRKPKRPSQFKVRGSATPRTDRCWTSFALRPRTEAGSLRSDEKVRQQQAGWVSPLEGRTPLRGFQFLVLERRFLVRCALIR